jgi:hypothetical protein
VRGRGWAWHAVHAGGLALAFLLGGWQGVATVAIVYPPTAWLAVKVDRRRAMTSIEVQCRLAWVNAAIWFWIERMKELVR